MNIHDILMKKAAKNELAHFYIVESSAAEDEAFASLMKFTHEFIRDYFQKIEGAKQSMVNLTDHPDVFLMGLHPEYEDKKNPNYIVEEAEAMIRFFEFKSVQGKRKFAVIPEGHKVTNIVANKWLKLLEEPTGNSTIFLLNPRRKHLLDTIHSRAQHLRLPVSKPLASLKDWKDFLQKTKGQELAQFIETNIKTEKDVFFWTNEMIAWETEQSDAIKEKMALTDWIKKLQEMETFNQPSATKWTLFYSYLQKHVLPRL